MKTIKQFSNSAVMRRCAQLGIGYLTAINSHYFVSQGKKPKHCEVQYDAAAKGVIGWGNSKRPLDKSDVPPFSKHLMHRLLKCEVVHG